MKNIFCFTFLAIAAIFVQAAQASQGSEREPTSVFSTPSYGAFKDGKEMQLAQRFRRFNRPFFRPRVAPRPRTNFKNNNLRRNFRAATQQRKRERQAKVRRLAADAKRVRANVRKRAQRFKSLTASAKLHTNNQPSKTIAGTKYKLKRGAARARIAKRRPIASTANNITLTSAMNKVKRRATRLIVHKPIKKGTLAQEYLKRSEHLGGVSNKALTQIPRSLFAKIDTFAFHRAKFKLQESSIRLNLAKIARPAFASKQIFRPVKVNGKYLNARESAIHHWHKRVSKGQFENLKSPAQYVQAAKAFLRSPPVGTKTKIRFTRDGKDYDILRFNSRTNTYAVMSSKGVPATMFKPDNGKKFWKEQRGVEVD